MAGARLTRDEREKGSHLPLSSCQHVERSENLGEGGKLDQASFCAFPPSRGRVSLSNLFSSASNQKLSEGFLLSRTMSLLAVPTPSSPVTIASTGSSDDGFEDADENDATSSSPPLSTTVQLGEVDPSTQLVAEVPSPVPAEEDKVVIEEAEPLSPALTSPETPTYVVLAACCPVV